MNGLIIWGGAVLLYISFRLWYDGAKKPLTQAEIEHYTAMMQDKSDAGLAAPDLEVVRRFMEEDDGKEFIMVNLVQFNPSPVVHPDSGKGVSAPKLLQDYTKPFLGKLLGRAGHPVIATRSVSGYLEAWDTTKDPGWHVAGLIRYRSRRDMLMSSIADLAFDEVHKYKIAAIAQTFAFPAKTQAAFYTSPRISVALVLALGAAVIQLIIS